MRDIQDPEKLADKIRARLKGGRNLEVHADGDQIFIGLNDWGGHWPVDEANGILDMLKAAQRTPDP